MRKLAAVASVGILLSVTACGGGGGNDTSFTAANAQAVMVAPGPDSNINLLFTTVTICAPGSSTNCIRPVHRTWVRPVLIAAGLTGSVDCNALIVASASAAFNR